MEYVFAIGIFGFIFCLVLVAFIHHSPGRRRKLAELEDKKEKLKNELKTIVVRMVIELNRMLTAGAISEADYDIEIEKAIDLLKSSNIDYSFIYTIKRPLPYDKEQKLKEIITIANTLDDRGEMSKKDYERQIDQALDELKKLK